MYYLLFTLFIIITIIIITKKETFSNSELQIYAICRHTHIKTFTKFLHDINLFNKTKIIPAINPQISPNKLLSNHAYTCTLAHLKVYNENFKYALIFEDDCQYFPSIYQHKSIQNIIEKFFNQFKDPNTILFLGFCAEHGSIYVTSIDNIQVYRLNSPRCLHSYIIPKNLAIKISNMKELEIKPIDEVIGYEIFTGNIKAFGINLFFQPWQTNLTDKNLINDI